jgi:hypothetical protein
MGVRGRPLKGECWTTVLPTLFPEAPRRVRFIVEFHSLDNLKDVGPKIAPDWKSLLVVAVTCSTANYGADGKSRRKTLFVVVLENSNLNCVPPSNGRRQELFACRQWLH